MPKIDLDTIPAGTAHEGMVLSKTLAKHAASGLQWNYVHIDPNVTLNKHSHPDIEWVYVISGTLHDEHGDYPAGTFLTNEKGSVHQTSSGPEGCELAVVWCGRVDPV